MANSIDDIHQSQAWRDLYKPDGVFGGQNELMKKTESDDAELVTDGPNNEVRHLNISVTPATAGNHPTQPATTNAAPEHTTPTSKQQHSHT